MCPFITAGVAAAVPLAASAFATHVGPSAAIPSQLSAKAVSEMCVCLWCVCVLFESPLHCHSATALKGIDSAWLASMDVTALDPSLDFAALAAELENGNADVFQ
jgi:hypothetical protein